MIPGICVPLCCLVDYKGFRLVAMSVAPINKKSIVYGSNNSGATLFPGNAFLNGKLEKASSILNLKKHVIKGTTLYGPVDMEAHLGFDGRLYLLDFSRVFPPESPRKELKGSHLYNLLRPEFCQHYRVPLCSDGFSGFVSEEGGREHNAEIDTATRYLRETLLPDFVNRDLLPQLEEALRKGTLEEYSLPQNMHSRGINIRHLGLMTILVACSSASPELIEETCVLLLSEMTARSVKILLRQAIRSRMRQLRVPLEQPYRQVCLDYLNLLLGDTLQSRQHWNTTLRKFIESKFSFSVTVALKEEPDLKAYLRKQRIGINGISVLLSRLQHMAGLTLDPNWTHRYAQSAKGSPLEEEHLVEMKERIKSMSIIDHAQGYLLKLKGVEQGSVPYLRNAILKFEEALAANPNNKFILRNLAYCLFRLEVQVETNKRLDQLLGSSQTALSSKPIELSFFSPQMERAKQYFLAAIQADASDAQTLYKYGHFLVRSGQIESALEYHLRALEEDPNHLPCLLSLEQLLTRIGKFELAQKIKERYLQVSFREPE
eukprot:TRINITY_DN2065_c0_g1_i20.p1 TRINITY_DN2065_c0_g1~~TRINITY_DN2065_c0_g1_i20.p1  ORF type:complete len:545 (+),score=110.97 TRINITY_DN2065_c0_g1_i20:1188-2822(+)